MKENLNQFKADLTAKFVARVRGAQDLRYGIDELIALGSSQIDRFVAAHLSDLRDGSDDYDRDPARIARRMEASHAALELVHEAMCETCPGTWDMEIVSYEL